MDDLRRTLPASWYRDEAQFQRELEAIWMREWLLVGHLSQWPKPGSFRVHETGPQQIVVVRDSRGWNAFHNTCRHRGARLCVDHSGSFKAGRVVCPYHAWAYGLDGALLTAPRMDEIEGFDAADYGLYRVAVAEVDSFVFVNPSLQVGAKSAPELATGLEPIRPWPLKELALAHQESHDVACNWKVFWENFLECYHCPSVHPDLCSLVPLYAQAVNSVDELPAGHPWRSQDNYPRLREGAVTWSPDGQTPLPAFEGLDEAHRNAGMTFGDAMPSAYLVAHLDHVRFVQIQPLDATHTRLTLNWLLHADTLAEGGLDIERLTAFARQVILEDAGISELNQQGLACSAHDVGVLSPVEQDVAAFQEWVKGRLQDDEQVSDPTGAPRADQ